MKKENYTIIIILAISIAFALVSFIVFISFGKSKRFVNWKVKLGAVLISLTTVVNTGCPITTCYVPPAPDEIEIQEIQENGIYQLEMMKDSIIDFYILGYMEYDFLSYRLFKEEVLMQNGIIDRSNDMDTTNYNYHINLNSNLTTGEYNLRFYLGKDNYEEEIGSFLFYIEND